jgi:hypothetical protein
MVRLSLFGYIFFDRYHAVGAHRRAKGARNAFGLVETLCDVIAQAVKFVFGNLDYFFGARFDTQPAAFAKLFFECHSICHFCSVSGTKRRRLKRYAPR